MTKTRALGTLASRCVHNRYARSGLMLEPANCPTGMVLALADALPTFGIKGPIGSQKLLAIGSRKVRHGVSKNEPYSTTLPRLRHAEFTWCGTVNTDAAYRGAMPPAMPK